MLIIKQPAIYRLSENLRLFISVFFNYVLIVGCHSLAYGLTHKHTPARGPRDFWPQEQTP